MEPEINSIIAAEGMEPFIKMQLPFLFDADKNILIKLIILCQF